MDQSARGQSSMLPGSMLAREFGKVYVRTDGAKLHVEFTVWLPELEGTQAERWSTGVALDASASMKDWYGRNLTGSVPQSAMEEYERKGWVLVNTEEGRAVRNFKKEAYEDAIKRDYVRFTKNVVEPLARDFIAYLARELDGNGVTSVIYWACGDGGAYEVLGDVNEEQCKSLKIDGPKSVSFGEKTKLTPAVRYFVERFTDAAQGLYVFFTDGKLDDLDDLKKYTVGLAKAVADKKRNPVKCILIGLGNQIDEKQLAELDDLETGTDVDVWDHKIARDLRDVSEIIVELVDENKVVASSAVVYDAAGAVVWRFTDGLPARASFAMPASSPYFELEVAGRRIRQSVVISASA